MASSKPSSATPGKPLSTTNVLLLTVLICAIVVVVGGLMTKRFVVELLTNQHVIQKESVADTQLGLNLQLAPQLVKNYQGQPEAVQQVISDALPTSASIPSLLAMLEHIAGSSGVTLRSFAPLSSADASAASAATSASSLGVNLAIEGSYVNVLKFLSNSQLSARPLQFSSLQMQGSASDVTATLNLTTFFKAAPSLQSQTETVK